MNNYAYFISLIYSTCNRYRYNIWQYTRYCILYNYL